MRKIDQFVNLYSINKTLRFRAIPIGKTQENINEKLLLQEDEMRAEKYKQAKKIIDRYHIDFIDEVLSEVKIDGVEEYITLFNQKEKSEEEKDKLKKWEETQRKVISDAFSSHSEFDDLFSKELIEDILPKHLKDEKEKEIIKSFVGFKTAFEGFNQNRKNMYSAEEKSTAISYRCINDNLPRFISNMNCYKRIQEGLDAAAFETIEKEQDITPYSVKDIFTSDFFSFVLSNKGIAFYNSIIGGYTTKDGQKVKGVNEYINLFNQQLSKKEGGKRLPLLKPLYKQVLSEYEGMSYYREGYKNASELVADLKDLVGQDSEVYQALLRIELIFSSFSNYDPAGIYVKNGISITELSNAITGDWGTYRNNWNKEYDKKNQNGRVTNLEKYEEKRRKEYNSCDSFSLEDIACHLGTEEKNYTIEDIINYYSETVKNLVQRIKDNYLEMKDILEAPFDAERLKTNEAGKIKDYLDSLKDLEKELKPLLGTGKEAEKDEVFYGDFSKEMDTLSAIDSLYNRTRDFVTRKPYSKEKFKLYFQNPQFLGGWDRNKVSDYRATLFRRNGLYYLAVIDKANSKILDTVERSDNADNYEVLDYKLIPDPSKQLPRIFFSKKWVPELHPSKEVVECYKNGSFKKGPSFNKKACDAIIDYYKNSLEKAGYNDIYKFHFSETKNFEDISGFFKEVDAQGYKLSFYKVNKDQIDDLIERGKIFLFQIYNKDFSPYSKGTENLHTMLFKQIFNEQTGGTLKLCGGAELFFRRASITDDNRIIHPAQASIQNKNPLNPKKESLFEYDIIKDKRYTVDQYEIHIPVTINRTPRGAQKLNDEVRKILREDVDSHIIGIDRGERNLLYVCVIDGDGHIVEQYSLNEIINEHNGMKIRTDYHELLSRKEDERAKARQEWSSIENIKELKEGYISQVVHKICSLVLKYDAVIAMEDLNSGFKNSRVKVEKQVYQKFEKALLDKFNYLTDKSIENDRNGSVARGFQLTNPFSGFKRMGTQNGFIFYVPAWLTSKIDPVTGFADLLKPKYTSILEAQEFIRSFDGISYDSKEEQFKFILDYNKFARADADFKKKWILYSNGTRIKTFRNPEKNSEWDNQEINLTNAFIQLLNKYAIDYRAGDLRESLCSQTDKGFFVGFMELLKLMLQMRNSVTGRTDVDYLISPVKNEKGQFYDSRNCANDLPRDADANGAFNIARKALWAIHQFKQADEKNLSKTKIAISNREWLEFAQNK